MTMMTSSYKFRFFASPPPPSSSSSSANNTSRASVSSTRSLDHSERMEVVEEDKANNGFSKPKQQPISTLIRSHRFFSTRTRQTIAVAGITVASLLALLSIFYLASIHQPDESTGNAVVTEHAFTEQLAKVNIQTNESTGDKELEKNHYELSHNFKIFKTKEGKAKYRELSFREYIPSTEFPALGEQLRKEENERRHLISEIAIEKTLVLVRNTVDADRKLISNKELRMWIPGTEQLRVLLVSTWEAGANFLSDMIQAHPGVFQHYEPLSYIGHRQVRSGKEAFQAQQVVHRLLDCNYQNLKAYINYTKTHLEDTIGHNDRVWKSCESGKSMMSCGDPEFLSAACKMFPIHLVKTVRLRLNLTHLLLNDQKLRVKVIFMVRDPREIMSSRIFNTEWCSSSNDCSSAEVLCQDMQGDLKVASAFEKLYPDRFLTVKYEDLVGNTEVEAGKIMSFLNLEFSDIIRKFLKVKSFEGQGSYNNTKTKAFRPIAYWKKDLSRERIDEIQNTCSNILKQLKYNILDS